MTPKRRPLGEAIGVLLAMLVFVLFASCSVRVGWALGDHVLRGGGP